MLFKIFVFAAALLVCSTNGELMRFKLSATNLPKSDLFGRWLDPYVWIFLRLSNGMEIPLGRTLTRFNTANPVWTTIFTVPILTGQQQKLHFKVFDRDIGFNDYIGDGVLDAETFFNLRSGGSTQVSLPNGNLIVSKI